MEQRRVVAERTVREFELPWPTLLDVVPGDGFAMLYGAWPTRFFVFMEDKLVWAARPVGCAYFVNDLANALDDVLGGI